jgi:hypothetical protein
MREGRSADEPVRGSSMAEQIRGALAPLALTVAIIGIGAVLAFV